MREGVVLGILIFSPPTRVKVGKLMCQGRLGSLGRLKRFFFFFFYFTKGRLYKEMHYQKTDLVIKSRPYIIGAAPIVRKR